MKVYLLHAIGIDGVQITEQQKKDLVRIMNAGNNSDKMLDINGYCVKVSAIMTIEPVNEQPKDYLIAKYDSEARDGLHLPYEKRVTYEDRLAIEQGNMVEEALKAKPDDKSAKLWDGAPKRGQFRSLHDYIQAKSKFVKESFNKKDR